MRALLALRHSLAELRENANLSILHTKKGDAFVYARGGLLLAVNPTAHEASAPVAAGDRALLFSIGGGRAEADRLVLEPQSFVVWA